jgi:hypothetical protein
MIDEGTPAIATNPAAVISVVFAGLAILSLCIAIAPIPLTGFVCFPAAMMLGGLAFATGLASLRQIRSSTGNGRTMALLATGIGAGAAIGALSMTALGFLVSLKILELLRQLVH